MVKCPRCGWKLYGESRPSKVDVQKTYPRAGEVWTPEEDTQLIEMAGTVGHKGVVPLAAKLGRQPTALLQRIQKLGLVLADAAPRKDVVGHIEPPEDTRSL